VKEWTWEMTRAWRELLDGLAELDGQFLGGPRAVADERRDSPPGPGGPEDLPEVASDALPRRKEDDSRRALGLPYGECMAWHEWMRATRAGVRVLSMDGRSPLWRHGKVHHLVQERGE